VFEVAGPADQDLLAGGWQPKGDPSGQRDKLIGVLERYNGKFMTRGGIPVAVRFVELSTSVLVLIRFSVP
jgi:hypothetical protein